MIKITTLFTFILFILLSSFTIAQTKTLQGTVISKVTGQPLAGVTIQINGSNNNSVSDANGNFSIGVHAGAVLTISYVGYITQQLVSDSLTDNIQVWLWPA